MDSRETDVAAYVRDTFARANAAIRQFAVAATAVWNSVDWHPGCNCQDCKRGRSQRGQAKPNQAEPS